MANHQAEGPPEEAESLHEEEETLASCEPAPETPREHQTTGACALQAQYFPQWVLRGPWTPQLQGTSTKDSLPCVTSWPLRLSLGVLNCGGSSHPCSDT